MRNFLLITATAATTLVSTSLQAALVDAVVFDSGAITSANGYTTGGLSGQGGTIGVGTFAAPGAYQVDATAGNARNFSNTVGSAGFGRALGSEAIDLEAQTVAVGDMIVITLSGLTVESDTNDPNVLRLGLVDAGGVGAGAFSVATEMTRTTADDDMVSLLLNGADTGIDIGTKFDLQVKLTAEAAGTATAVNYTVESFVNSGLIAGATQTGVTPAGNLATGGTAFQGLIQDFDGNTTDHSRFTFEGFSVTTVAVPEPGSLVLVGLGAAALLSNRRRQH